MSTGSGDKPGGSSSPGRPAADTPQRLVVRSLGRDRRPAIDGRERHRGRESRVGSASSAAIGGPTPPRHAALARADRDRRRDAVGPLPRHAQGRPGRHGRGLRGDAHADRQARRGEGPAREVRAARGDRRAPQAGGAARVVDRQRAHHRHHRLRQDRGRPHVRRDGVPRGRVARRVPRAREPAARAADPADRRAGGVGARRRARQGHRPPRHQAGEPLPAAAQGAGLREGRRLRHLEVAARERRGRGAAAADADRHGARHAALHVARAGARRRRARSPRRHLRARRDHVRGRDRPRAVRRQQLPVA